MADTDDQKKKDKKEEGDKKEDESEQRLPSTGTYRSAKNEEDQKDE